MDIQYIVDLVATQVGEDKVKEFKVLAETLISKFDKEIYILTKVKGKVCLLKSDMNNIDINFTKQPKVTVIEDELSKIEV